MGVIITDVAGTALSAEDRELLAHPTVAGVILFTRNYENRTQLSELTHQIKRCRSNLFVVVDHEGGRVQRFQEGFTLLPSMAEFGRQYQKNPELAKRTLHQTITLAAKELRAVGVNINLVPVLDINWGTSEIIGERSFSHDPAVIIALASVLIDALHHEKMPATGKHFPGHGGVALDSHKTLPVDTRSWESLAADLMPFKRLAHLLDAIMPSHVVYSALDQKPAGFSPYWIQTVLRKMIDFQGVVITDDLSMGAPATLGSYPERAGLALEAGCDLLTICNNREGAIQVIDALPQAKRLSERLSLFLARLGL